MSRSYLLVLSEVAALGWVLTEQRMAFNAWRRSQAMTLEIGDELLMYTTRACFHNPARDRGLVMGMAMVKSTPHDLPEPVVFGERHFTLGCDLKIHGLAALHHGVELLPLVPELHAFPDPRWWTAWLRRTLVRLDAHDSDRLKAELTSLLEPPSRHLEAYLEAVQFSRTGRQRRLDRHRVLPLAANLGARSDQGEGMTYYEAAIEVLRTAKRPLTAQEITNRAIEKGLIMPSGKTPGATMAAVLYVRLPNDPDLLKLEDRGDRRAKRGSVRWTLRRV